MDNNTSERAIHDFCIGKKNWQMIDAIHGVKASAVICSIVETAKANSLKPFDYVRYLFRRASKTYGEYRSVLPKKSVVMVKNSSGRDSQEINCGD